VGRGFAVWYWGNGLREMDGRNRLSGIFLKVDSVALLLEDFYRDTKAHNCFKSDPPRW